MIAGIVASQLKKIIASFDSNGGTPTYSNQIGYGSSLSVSNPGTPSRGGYTFNGWSPTVPRVISANTNFVAQWQTAGGTTSNPTITFVSKGVSGLYAYVRWQVKNNDASTATIYSDIDTAPSTSRGSIASNGWTATLEKNDLFPTGAGWTIYARATASGKTTSSTVSLWVDDY